MSLADELLADFDDVLPEIPDHSDLIEKNDSSFKTALNKKSVYNVAKLMKDEKNLQILRDIKVSNKAKMEICNKADYYSEYDLIVNSNKLLSEIDTEITIVHRHIKDLYNKRFPELEMLVLSPYEYIKTVSFLKDNVNSSRIDGIDFLPPATKMVLTVTATTTPGVRLSDEDMSTIEEACELGFELVENKVMLLEYVQSRMSIVAPNLCRIIGPTSAAEIMGAAGGLCNLSKMPGCNIILLGSQRRSLAGFASTSVLPHTGFVYFSQLVQRLPPQMRKKGARVVSSKLALAARIDQNREYKDGSYGDQILNELEKKYARWLAPPPVKDIKALPRPDDQPRKKRGGRRQRSMKQKYALTELRKQAKRVHFGQIQEDIYQDNIGFGLNSLSQSESGKLRIPSIDTKTKVSISKRLQKNMSTMSNSFGTRTVMRSNVSGLASSVAFTPLQGIEIINPNLSTSNQKGEQDNAKYFSYKSGFQSGIQQ